MTVSIRTISEFDRQIKKLAKKYHSIPTDFRILLDSLKENPMQGADLGDGIRKVRMAIASKGRGKSGGARVITYSITQDEDSICVSLLTIYDKSEIESVSEEYIKSLL